MAQAEPDAFSPNDPFPDLFFPNAVLLLCTVCLLAQVYYVMGTAGLDASGKKSMGGERLPVSLRDTRGSERARTLLRESGVGVQDTTWSRNRGEEDSLVDAVRKTISQSPHVYTFLPFPFPLHDPKYI